MESSLPDQAAQETDKKALAALLLTRYYAGQEAPLNLVLIAEAMVDAGIDTTYLARAIERRFAELQLLDQGITFVGDGNPRVAALRARHPELRDVIDRRRIELRAWAALGRGSEEGAEDVPVEESGQ